MTITISGKTYALRKPTVAVLTELARLFKTSPLFTEDWYDALSDPARGEPLKTEWRKLLALLLHDADERLELLNLTTEEISSIPRAFLANAIAAHGVAASDLLQTEGALEKKIR